MLIGLSLCGACLCTVKRSRLKDAIFLLVSFAVLFALSAIRYDVGYDYSFVYAPIYDRILNDPTSEFMAQHRWEPGFTLLLRGLMLVTPNFQALFVLTSFLIIFLVMLFYWRYSLNPFISVFLFVALSHYYCSMNFVRQTLAAAIAMFTLPLLKKFIEYFMEKRWSPAMAGYAVGYFAVVLLAASMHMSALLLIPFFFINLVPINKYVLAAYVAITAAIYFNTHRILEFVTQHWYQYYSLNNIHMQAVFAPQFTIAVAIVFLILFLGSGALKRLDKGNYLYVNYAFFAFFFALMGTRHSILDRLGLNFALLAPVGISILVGELAKKLKEEDPSALIRKYTVKYTAVFIALLITIFGGGLGIHHFALTRDHHGVVPYQIIFHQPFYREYVYWLRTGNPDIYDWGEPYMEPEDIEMPLSLPPPAAPPYSHVDLQEVEQYEPVGDAPVQVSIEELIG